MLGKMLSASGDHAAACEHLGAAARHAPSSCAQHLQVKLPEGITSVQCSECKGVFAVQVQPAHVRLCELSLAVPHDHLREALEVRRAARQQGARAELDAAAPLPLGELRCHVVVAAVAACKVCARARSFSTATRASRQACTGLMRHCRVRQSPTSASNSARRVAAGRGGGGSARGGTFAWTGPFATAPARVHARARAATSPAHAVAHARSSASSACWPDAAVVTNAAVDAAASALRLAPAFASAPAARASSEAAA